MIKLPMKFYSAHNPSTPSTPSTSNTNKYEKYEISITQTSKHKSTFDYIRGISYDAKDNVIHCTVRNMNLDEVKEMYPEATTVPKDACVLQDMNGDDLIITSDMIENMAQMLVILHTGNGIINCAIHYTIYRLKRYYEGKSVAFIKYSAYPFGTCFVKMSDVDIWMDNDS